MADIQITSPEGLIESKIIPIKVIFYLVTNDNLNTIKSKSILSDIFTLLASLMWGAYLSILITLKISFEPSNKEQIILETLQNVFLWAGILFTALALIFITWNFVVLKQIKRNELKIGKTDKSSDE
jgi:hypothetical protein